MRRFAKVFDVGEQQLLVHIGDVDDDDDRDGYVKLHQITDIGAAMLDVALTGPEEAMRKVLDAYDQTVAENFFKIDIVAKAVSSFAAT